MTENQWDECLSNVNKIIIILLVFIISGCTTSQIKREAPITAIFIDFMPCFEGMGLAEFSDKTERTPEAERRVKECQYNALYLVVEDYAFSAFDYHIYIRLEPNYMEYAGTAKEVMSRIKLTISKKKLNQWNSLNQI